MAFYGFIGLFSGFFARMGASDQQETIQTCANSHRATTLVNLDLVASRTLVFTQAEDVVTFAGAVIFFSLRPLVKFASDGMRCRHV